MATVQHWRLRQVSANGLPRHVASCRVFSHIPCFRIMKCGPLCSALKSHHHYRPPPLIGEKTNYWNLFYEFTFLSSTGKDCEAYVIFRILFSVYQTINRLAITKNSYTTECSQGSKSIRVYPKVSGLAAWSENCKWYSSLPLGAVISLFCESL
jgi:hypothetical protein